jgi:hypothetical protein
MAPVPQGTFQRDLPAELARKLWGWARQPAQPHSLGPIFAQRSGRLSRPVRGGASRAGVEHAAEADGDGLVELIEVAVGR